MSKEEFLKLLEENKYFEDYKENAMHRFPAIQYFIDNELKVILNGTNLSKFIGTVKEPKDDADYQLVCIAFNGLRQKYGFNK